MVAGSRMPVHALLRAEVVDELHLQLFPLLLGSGARLYPEAADQRRLDLVSSEALPRGVVLQHLRDLAQTRSTPRLAVAFRPLSGGFTPFHRGGSGSPLVCLHGFTDTWRTWELVLPALERRHDVLALTLAGHAGGPPIEGKVDDAALADAVELAMDAAGFATAHLVGNSLGGYLALQLAARGRARTVVSLAPAGGWARGDESFKATLAYFATMQELLVSAVPHAEAILATPEGRRRATEDMTTNFEHLEVELLAHLMRGAARCSAVFDLIEHAEREGWSIDAERIACPVRIVWGTEDRLLAWPSAAARYREEWLPHADWVELEGIGHCPQLDVPLETAELILGFASR